VRQIVTCWYVRSVHVCTGGCSSSHETKACGYAAGRAGFGRGFTVHFLNFLLLHGANLEARDSEGRTPLMHALSGGHNFLIDRLLKEGANPHATTPTGATCMHCAALQLTAEWTQRLHNTHGLSYHTITQDGHTPLSIAISAERDGPAAFLARVERVHTAGLALAMGTHHRLGSASVLALLANDVDVLQLIVDKATDPFPLTGAARDLARQQYRVATASRKGHQYPWVAVTGAIIANAPAALAATTLALDNAPAAVTASVIAAVIACLALVLGVTSGFVLRNYTTTRRQLRNTATLSKK
jgi:hypothetical protein